MKLTNTELQVKNILMDCTGWTFIKSKDEGETIYTLIDNYGEVDGEPIEDFDVLIDFISNDSDVENELTLLEIN